MEPCVSRIKAYLIIYRTIYWLSNLSSFERTGQSNSNYLVAKQICNFVLFWCQGLKSWEREFWKRHCARPVLRDQLEFQLTELTWNPLKCFQNFQTNWLFSYQSWFQPRFLLGDSDSNLRKLAQRKTDCVASFVRGNSSQNLFAFI